MRVSKEARLVILKGIIGGIFTVAMVTGGAYLTYQYARYSAVKEWKREAYSTLVSEIMYFAPQALIDLFPKTVKECRKSPVVVSRQYREASEISEDEWKNAIPRIDKALGKAFLLADSPLRNRLIALRNDIRDHVKIRKALSSVEDLRGLKFNYRSWSFNSLKEQDKIIMLSISEWCEKELPRLRALAKSQEDFLLALREDLGLH